MRIVAIFVSIVIVASAGFAASHKPKPPRPGGGSDVNERSLTTSGGTEMVGEIWVDNWFALWMNGAPFIEDSVSITTERSINAEKFTFNADLPVTFAFAFKDFMENATGLEYIGTRKQQMGGGGAIAQFSVGGKVVGATSDAMKCLVVQHAPVSTSCERARNPAVDQGDCAQLVTAAPTGWQDSRFDDSAWPNAVAHSARAVGPKDGYDAISWDRSANHLGAGPGTRQRSAVSINGRVNWISRPRGVG